MQVCSAMHETEQFSALIAYCYHAALNPAMWVDVLKQAARFVGGSAASLYSRDVVRKTGNVVYQFGIDLQYEQLFLDKYIKLDPTAIGYFRLH